MRRKHLILAATATALAGLAWGGEPGAVRWLNLHATDRHADTDVMLHVPFSLLAAVLEAVDTSSFHGGKVRLCLDDLDLDWVAVAGDLQHRAEGEVVALAEHGADVRLVKRGGSVLIDVTPRSGAGEHVTARLPVALLDAVRADERHRLDLAALLTRVDDLADGELLLLEGDGTNVRIWME